MENRLDSSYSTIECHNDYLEVYRGEYTCDKEGVKIMKENWKKYLVVLQDVKGIYSNFMIYNKSSKNWQSETPKYKFDLTSGKFEVKAQSYRKDRFLFEVYFEESETRFLVSAKDEDTRNMWIHWLTSTKYIDPFASNGPVYLVKVLDTPETRKFHIAGICYIHLLADRILLSRMCDRSLLADWPLRVIRFYASRQDMLKLELGRKAMHGEMIVYLQTNKSKDLFHFIKSSITGCHEEAEKPRKTPVALADAPFAASAEYATVNLKQKASRRVLLAETKSAVAFRKFCTPPPPTVCDYEPVTINMAELEKQTALPSRDSRQLIPFEEFSDYDTLQHMRSAFGNSRSSSSQSDNSESDSTSGEYCCLRESPKSSPPHQLVTVCTRQRETRKSLIFDEAQYSTVRTPGLQTSISSDDLLSSSQKKVVTNLWSCQSRAPLPSPPSASRYTPRKKTSGIDDMISYALDSLTIPENNSNILIETPKEEATTQNEPSQIPKNRNKCIINRRNGTRHRNRNSRPSLPSYVFQCS